MKKAKDIQKEITKSQIDKTLIDVLHYSGDTILSGLKGKIGDQAATGSWLAHALSGDRSEREIAKQQAKSKKIAVKDSLDFRQRIVNVVAGPDKKDSLSSFFAEKCELDLTAVEVKEEEEEEAEGIGDENDDGTALPGPDQLKLYIKK